MENDKLENQKETLIHQVSLKLWIPKLGLVRHHRKKKTQKKQYSIKEKGKDQPEEKQCLSISDRSV